MDLRLKIPISLKLSLVTVILILAVVLPIAFRSSQLFESSFGRSQYDANAELANSKSSEIEALVLSQLEKVRTVTSLLVQDYSDDEQRRRALALVFYRDLDLVNIDIYELKSGRPFLLKRETNEIYLKNFDLTKSYIDRVRREMPFPTLSLFSENDRILIQNSTLRAGAPLFSIGVPFPDENGAIRHVVVADIRLDRLQKAFTLGGARTLYLVDSRGSVLAHSNDQMALDGTNLKHVPIVDEALSRGNGAMRGQKRFKDPSQQKWFVGAYSKTAFGLTVVTQAPEEIILEPARLVRRDAYEVAGYVLSGALFFVILFALSLTHPIEKLHEATEYVARGHFDVRAKVRTHDEVGELAKAFNHMVEGLQERDKIKNIFNKFHGSSVTEDLLKKDLNLGGTRKQVTVFFSDIRDFTKFSEGHTPEEVVEMLNEYFQIMVSIITSNKGIVDKFVGDAIMAVWGAPNSTGQDREFALKAALEMRVALNDLNSKRLSRGHTAIKIGMGLHSGPAISGTIGSSERMEYTVIGDTVNMASRIEASTKAFGADLLVSETVTQGLEQFFIFDLAGSAEVKGKSEPIKMYKVRGIIEENGQHIIVQTPFSDFAAEIADKVKVA